MFFNLHSKMKILGFPLIIIITVTIQVAVLNQFSWNSRGRWRSTHGWNLLFLETIDPIEPLIYGENGPPKTGFPAFIQPLWTFSRKKISKPFSVLIFYRKGCIHFCHPMPHSLKICDPTKKLFSWLFWKILFFSKQFPNWNIFKTSFSTKKVILIFLARRPLPLETVMSSHQWFFAICLM